MRATKVFINGEVITADQSGTVYEALAIRGERILQVGTTSEVMERSDDNTEIINLNGKSLLPGFNDAHAHLELYGTNQLGVNMKQVNSIDSIIEKLQTRAEQTPSGEWVRGWGYNQNNLLEDRHLTKWDLDKVSTSHPIIVVRTCGHISCVNSKALEMAGIHLQTPNPPGGTYHRDGDELTGLLLEAAHMKMFQLADYSEDEVMLGLQMASDRFLQNGITSLHDAGGYGTKHIRYLQKGAQEGKIRQRVYVMYASLFDSPSVVKAGVESGIMTGLGDDTFKIGPAKVFIDGSSSGPTCKTREPYTSNPNDSGILYMDQNELDQHLLPAHKKGWQITAHAMGDEAVHMLLTTIERALNHKPSTDHRHRLEHAGITPPDLVERIKATRAVPIPNPAFLYEFGDGYINDYGERVHYFFPLKSYIEQDIPFAIGSDSPITTVNPLIGIHAAVNRTSKHGHPVGQNQSITVEEAIRAYTWAGAYASGEEDLKGTLEPVKYADFVILDQSILRCPSQKIKDIQVEMTILNGDIVYEKQKEDAH
ncbi:amidohydrolase family protein [Halobacillus litoralis]|uniref:Amidohydrolase family protein n=1 Tax=Halobacillus litoralis TaxID=45668 RepID=A0A845F9M7_9BACI|nr:amidohydrolase [Halobacillus litoralis]MYL70365.1 amidohydrolase family protein [Halobacillus litoralis]